MALNISVAQSPDEAIIKLSGELDAATAPQFKEAIENAAEAKPKRLVFLMGELEFWSAPACGW
jgi:anti-anti-sigma factor